MYKFMYPIKTFTMKNILYPLFLLLGITIATGQTTTTSIVTPPCHGDGVVVTTVTGATPPFDVFYYYGGYGAIAPTHHTSVLGTTDTLSSWIGGNLNVLVFAYSSSTSLVGWDTVSSGPLYFSLSGASAVCPVPDTATALVTGGTGPYTYAWYNDTGTLVSTANPMTTVVSGNYYLVATDAAGCYMDSRYTLDSAVFLYSAAPFTFSLTGTPASCTDGTASVTGITGGMWPYSYLWSNGATTATISSLVAGNYWVNISDAYGCTSNDNLVNIAQVPVMHVYTTVTPATCHDTDGAVIAFGSGGVPPYSYSWSNGATTQSQTGLPACTLGVTVTDAHGCHGDSSVVVTMSTPITVTYGTTPSACTGPTGTATLTISGGTLPYTVEWGTYPVQTGLTASGLTIGYYSFHVTDSAGCVQTGTVYIPPVDVITASFSIYPAACTSATGSIVVTPFGGVPPYCYSWSTGGSASSISGLTAGWYTVTITDSNHCTLVKSPEVPSSSPVHLGFATTPASCIYSADGSIIAVASGGTLPYTYTWNTGATGSTISVLVARVYSVSVVDAAGCTARDTVTLSYNPYTDFCYCTITGTVYYDMNGNCIRDAGEPGINNVAMHCAGFGYTFTDSNGVYSFKVPTGAYTLSQHVLAYYPLSSCQMNNFPVAVTAASGCVDTFNFADTLTPLHDIHICTWDYNQPVIGHTYTQTTIIANQGTITEPNILASYNADGQLYAPSFVPSGIFMPGGGYYYNTPGTFPSVAAGHTKQFFMQ